MANTSYTTKTLSDGERILYAGRLSFVPLMMCFIWLLFGVIFSLIGGLRYFYYGLLGINPLFMMSIGLPFLGIIYWLIQTSTREFVITNQRVVLRTGLFFWGRSLEIRLKSVDTIGVNMGFWAGVWGYGDFHVITSGVHCKFTYLDSPLRFRAALLQACKDFGYQS